MISPAHNQHYNGKPSVSNCHSAPTYSNAEYKYVCSECDQPCIGVKPKKRKKEQ